MSCLQSQSSSTASGTVKRHAISKKRVYYGRASGNYPRDNIRVTQPGACLQRVFNMQGYVIIIAHSCRNATL
ncbi:hypothetical protein Aam_020_010 [Acidocella aminolytica 101 = DSM 11237]|uniref:Uncharacterized protein n=1 Tax=Acidocella aminolytica 101 = DSM 11237 TaxID=1120923 RepID=A0A0D6PD20_9PROT|nr:hypothetical protein Aam_020_010 [Acidocella aminolytica 101 = DSM 11237]GBQ39749.1 hypothetical protein AA11237_2170 [Acidocella aminolytica 101 = DSM 11237]